MPCVLEGYDNISHLLGVLSLARTGFMKTEIKEVWFVTGSQHLYGPATLKKVDEQARQVASGLDGSAKISCKVVCQGVVKTPAEITDVMQRANTNSACIGLICWMHTFSPAKMWIQGLNILSKPFMHLHTQFAAALPFESIDMDFMNLNQSAHGGREFGFIGTRMRKERKVVVGHWAVAEVQDQIDDWIRAAKGFHAVQNLKVARFGDNMREVAVTEGNKVSAQITFGMAVHGYGVGDLAEVVNQVSEAEVKELLDIYATEYVIAKSLSSDAQQMEVLRKEARLEAGMKKFLEAGEFSAFTNTFENLHGLTNLPGLATQRLMAQGYGYGGEGDWKTSAFTHVLKVMGEGKGVGTSFMEDYTYNFASPAQVLGAHMLEVCPSIAADKPHLEVHLHTIGCKADVARLIFNGKPGAAINLSCIDLGNRFRFILNEVDSVKPSQDLPKLPVARTLWQPKPNLSVAAAAWIHAGGAHHTTYSQSVTTDMIADFAEMVDVELVVIDGSTEIRDFKKELRQNAVYYHLNQGL